MTNTNIYKTNEHKYNSKTSSPAELCPLIYTNTNTYTDTNTKSYKYWYRYIQ